MVGEADGGSSVQGAALSKNAIVVGSSQTSAKAREEVIRHVIFLFIEPCCFTGGVDLLLHRGVFHTVQPRTVQSLFTLFSLSHCSTPPVLSLSHVFGLPR